MKSESKWNRVQIDDLLRTNNAAVERGIVRIFDLQTFDEKVDERTNKKNNVGFNKSDAKYGTYLATWVKKGKHLTGNHLEAARRMCLFYSRQLTAIANGEL